MMVTTAYKLSPLTKRSRGEVFVCAIAPIYVTVDIARWAIPAPAVG